MADLRRRTAARVIILDASSSVLLVRYAEHRPGRGASYWATPGGGIEEGESARDAAIRELQEETGLPGTVGVQLFTHVKQFELPSGWVAQEEEYFLVRRTVTAPPVRNSSPEPIIEHRWWRLEELRASDETIYPQGLAERLTPIVASAA